MTGLTELVKMVGPWGPVLALIIVVCFLAGVGLIALAIRWKQIKRFFSNGGMDRQGNDALVNRLVGQNADMMGAMMKVVTDNTAALQKVTGALEENGRKLDRHHDSLERGFSTIHRRLDEALERRAG